MNMKSKNTLKLIISISFILIAGCSEETQCIDSDLVFLNNTIYTANPDQPKAELLAIKAGKIIYVGSSSQVNSYNCGNNKVSELENSFIFPGFIDAHAHLKGIGYRELNLNLINPILSKILSLQILMTSYTVYY